MGVEYNRLRYWHCIALGGFGQVSILWMCVAREEALDACVQRNEGRVNVSGTSLPLGMVQFRALRRVHGVRFVLVACGFPPHVSASEAQVFYTFFIFSEAFSMCTGLDLLGVAMVESIEASQRFEDEGRGRRWRPSKLF